MNKMLTVFNDQGNFAGNLEVSPTLTLAEIKSILAPHRVEESAHNATAVCIVKPMLGLSVNEEGFLKLVRQQLRAGGALVDAGNLESGYGPFTLSAEFTPVGQSYESTITIRRTDTATAVLTLTTRGIDGMDSGAEDINSLTETAQALNVLVSQGTEFVVEKIREFQDQRFPAQPLPDDSLGKRMERVRAPGAPVDPRKLVHDAVAAVKANSAKPQPTAPTEVLGLIQIHPGDRDNPFCIIIQMTSDDYEQFVAEGILTTIVATLPGASIVNNTLAFESSKGYLRNIRNALADHGLEPISITPRELGSLNEDEEERLVNLIP